DVCSSDLVAGGALPAGAGDGGDDMGAGVDAAHAVVFGIDDEEVVVAVDGDPLRAVEGGLERRSSVAAVALLAPAGNGGDAGGPGVHAAHAVPLPLADKEIAGAVADHRARAVQRRGGRRTAIARVLALA